MNTGLAQGFVRYGTAGHAVLIHAYAVGGNVSLRSLHDAYPHITTNSLAITLTRLVKMKMLFVAGRDREPLQRSYALYSLKHPGWKVKPPKAIPPNVRTKEYMKRKRMRVASVFNFRGEVQL